MTSRDSNNASHRPPRRAVPPQRGGAPLEDLSPPFASVVLLVDDEPEILEGLRWALRKEPFEIMAATSAREALNVLARAHVDVIVSDDRMPGMSGSELLGVVRRTYPLVARVVLTGGSSLDAAARAISEGEAHAFLTKPCDAATLATLIQDARDSCASAAAAAASCSEIEDSENVADSSWSSHTGSVLPSKRSSGPGERGS